ncbi:protein DpdJ [Aneurinibacillus sp. UBA3580]|jgi:hypothetical protein|uniref:protein DpdJ n=1 Tax=Aneurinibacillus sp. UBA3580 TaxID=1946041 RepID=UPI002580B7A8|nr:protein DpdJ [Aneurinibacillus sp. UBA3580]
MTRTPIDVAAEELLTQLEQKENKLLEWGIIGGSMDAEREIAALLFSPPTSRLQELLELPDLKGVDARLFVENLVERKLLFRLANGQYRSRYAETVRLLYLLKQRFSFDDWLDAPNLVSNIKPMIEYRKYPRRDQLFADLADKLSALPGIPQSAETVLRELLEDGTLQLARFQVKALLHLLGQGEQTFDRGAVVGAGTGSGKTKAFYLPAFVEIMAVLERDTSPWMKVLGIYPRVELLKDQYREAVREILKLGPYARSRGIRSVTIGCYYGDTPHHAGEVANASSKRKWRKVSQGYVAPFLSCPHCGGTLVWREDDIQREVERLTCIEEACGKVLEPDTIMLTRRRMQQTPPDILFTTTEMLNRKMTNLTDWPVFGIGASRPPMFLLLDEIHIYDGVNGAHTAYLLRRWRHLVRRTSRVRSGMQFVGLSATLSNPRPFFAQLTGLSEDFIVYITPEEEDMVVEGAEYNLIVRGDPFSATALLSTSVQTAMLMGRMLDPLDSDVSRGAVGSKLFGFTDKLDIINRWYHIELDAEKKLLLSQYRDVTGLKHQQRATGTARHLAGQIWAFAQQIDPHCLTTPLALDIASSQYKGVDEKARFVIATSALEVGYNDVRVGAVIQHKAPRSLASFLQRKGRAGRMRGMRPWTLVITSAFGRDRFAYEYPELLFAPLLNDMCLPMQNPYVQRIQAAFALMDWLALKLSGRVSHADVRNLLTIQGARHSDQQTYISRLLLQVLQDEETDFTDYLGQALGIAPEQIKQILWTQPRPLYMELFPTLINNLETSFKYADEEEQQTPLSGFVPRALFQSLSMSDLEIQVPNERTEYQPLVQAIMDFAPGNVSKRYVNVYRTQEAHWLPVPDSGVVNLDQANMRVRLLQHVEEDGHKLAVCEPYAYLLEQIPKMITDRTSASLEWRVMFEPFDSESGSEIILPLQSAVRGLFRQISCYTSDENQYVKVTRYAPVSHVTMKFTNGTVTSKVASFQYKGEQAAIGFQRLVDAVRFSLAGIKADFLFRMNEWNEMEKACRPEYYLYLTRHDPEISGRLNVFQVQWLSQIVLSSIVAIAVSRASSLSEAASEFSGNYVRIARRTLDVIFHSTVTENTDAEQSESPKVYNELLGFIQDAALMERFLKHLTVFESDMRQNPAFARWIMDTLVTTAGAAIQKTVEDMLPDVNTDDLVLDIDGTDIWLSENEAGGIGIITKIVSLLRSRPSQFEELFIKNLEYCPRHHITSSLRAVLPHTLQGTLASLLSAIREESRIERQQQLLQQLQRELDKEGIAPEREFIISFSTRIVRGRGGQEADLLRHDLHRFWQEEEERLRCKIDSYVFAVACFNRKGIRERIEDLLQKNAGDGISEKQRFLLVESLLFADCVDSCPECLVLYSPFQRFMKPSRQLLEHLLPKPYEIVRCGEDNWQEHIRSILYAGKRVRLVAHVSQKREAQQALFTLLHTPVQYAYELYYPYIEKVTQNGTEWQFDLRIREVSYE